MNAVRYIFIFITLLLFMFILQNASTVNIDFAFWEINTSLALVIIGSALLGALGMFLFTLPARFRRNKEIAQLKNKIQQKTLEHSEH